MRNGFEIPCRSFRIKNGNDGAKFGLIFHSHWLGICNHFDAAIHSGLVTVCLSVSAVAECESLLLMMHTASGDWKGYWTMIIRRKDMEEKDITFYWSSREFVRSVRPFFGHESSWSILMGTFSLCPCFRGWYQFNVASYNLLHFVLDSLQRLLLSFTKERNGIILAIWKVGQGDETGKELFISTEMFVYRFQEYLRSKGTNKMNSRSK